MSKTIDRTSAKLPLHHGDRLSIEDFRHRNQAMPEGWKAELLEGMVYLQYNTGRIIDPRIPPLQNGDHLALEEFERRWNNMPDLKKVELLNGVVFMPPPVSVTEHGFPHSDLIYWLGSYRVATHGVRLADNGTLRSSNETESQPDAMLVILPEFGGNVAFDSAGVAVGAPELVAEVSSTSVNYDLHTKLQIYQELGIPEYLVWRTADRAVDWFVLRDSRYVRLEPSSDGILRSSVFPGLWLDWAALVNGDMQNVARILQQGMATAEYTAFAKGLQDRSGSHR